LVRSYRPEDLVRLSQIHAENALPDVCMPDLDSPSFEVKQVVEVDGQIVMGAFVRKVGEAYLLVSHDVGDPESRWEMLKELAETMADAAYLKGFADCSVWVPHELEAAFGKRLEALGFKRSPWTSYTRTV
jgi:hypothetical protein